MWEIGFLLLLMAKLLTRVLKPVVAILLWNTFGLPTVTPEQGFGLVLIYFVWRLFPRLTIKKCCTLQSAEIEE